MTKFNKVVCYITAGKRNFQINFMHQ